MTARISLIHGKARGHRPRLQNYGFSSAEDPAKTFFPSLSVTVVAFARFDPSFALKPITVTISPTFSEFRVQPRRINPAGLVNSISQSTILPLLSFTSQ